MWTLFLCPIRKLNMNPMSQMLNAHSNELIHDWFSWVDQVCWLQNLKFNIDLLYLYHTSSLLDFFYFICFNVTVSYNYYND